MQERQPLCGSRYKFRYFFNSSDPFLFVSPSTGPGWGMRQYIKSGTFGNNLLFTFWPPADIRPIANHVSRHLHSMMPWKHSQHPSLSFGSDMRTGILGEHASIGGGSQSLLIELPISLGMSNLNLPHTSQAAPTKVVWNKFNRTLSRRTMLQAASCLLEGPADLCFGILDPFCPLGTHCLGSHPSHTPLSSYSSLLIIIWSISWDAERNKKSWLVGVDAAAGVSFESRHGPTWNIKTVGNIKTKQICAIPTLVPNPWLHYWPRTRIQSRQILTVSHSVPDSRPRIRSKCTNDECRQFSQAENPSRSILQLTRVQIIFTHWRPLLHSHSCKRQQPAHLQEACIAD